MPIIQSDQKFYITETNQDKFIQEMMPFTENLVYGAALALNCQAAFMVLLIAKQVKLVGSFGLDIEQFSSIERLPTWLMPTQAGQINHPAQLKEMSVVTGHQGIKNACGVSIILPQGIVGALWFLNSVSNQDLSRQNQLLEVYAHQTSLSIKRQIELFEMQQPHKIARERDSLLSIANSLPSSVMLSDLHGVIQFANATFFKHFGYVSEEVLRLHIENFVLPEYHKSIQNVLTTKSTGQPTMNRYKMLRKDQSVADVEFIGYPHLDSLGRTLGNIIILRDISEELALEQAALEARKAISKKLKDTLHDTQRSLEQEKIFAFEILERLEDGFALLNHKIQFEYVNPAFAAMVQFSPQALIGIEAPSFVHPEDFERVRSLLAKREPLQVLNVQHRVNTLDGTILHAASRISSRFDAQGQVIGTLLNVRDITKKVLDEEKFADSQRQLQYQRDMAMTIVQTAQEGFLILKGEIIEFINHQFEIILGTTANHLIGHNIYEFVHPDDVYLSQQATQTMAKGESMRYQQRIIRPSGEERTIVFNASPRRSASGRIFGMVGSVRDITNELASQAKVTQLEQQIENAKQKLEHGQGFSGRLEDVGGTVGLLQMIAASPVSGAILFDDDAQLFLLGGRVVAVVHPVLIGNQAVAKLVQREHGQFQFIPNLRPEKTMFNLDPVKLALEFLTKQDELTAPKQLPPAPQNVVTVPNSIAAKAFIGGVGGIRHFKLSLEQNQVVLHGRGLKVIVLEAQISEFLGQIELDHQDTSPM
jgi:PAS domain S-box-containing protein